MRGIPANWLQARMGSMRLGEILLDHAVLNKAQLKCVLGLQRESGKRIGEMLIDMALATPDQVQLALDEQRKMEVT